MEWQEADTLIRTKLHLPYTRPERVPRPRLETRVLEGLRRPLTLITAPAGFGKTTLVASCAADCGMRVAWLSLDKGDNQAGRFLSYVIAAFQQADSTIGNEAAQLLAARQAPSHAVLTSLINDLHTAGREIALVLDDYQVIRSRVVHEAVAFLLENCPKTFHVVIATRSDPPLSLSRFRARDQMVEFRRADLCFTEPEAAQFLNEIMGLDLDARSVAVLEARTEGWIAGLQMAALSMRHREDVPGFIEGFSGTNRYIMDYLLEEVLASQSPEIKRFLLYTSILERVTAPLCDAVLASEEGSEWKGDSQLTRSESLISSQSASILEYLERANLFLVPLDEERVWYRYHHLFSDLLRTQVQRSLGAQGVAQLHVRASEWHEQNGSILEAIHHASAAADDERLERLIEQHYMEMATRGEMSGYRYWAGTLSKDLVHRRPWLCIYEAYSHAWFGELDEADRLLAVAEKQIQSGVLAPDAPLMQAQLSYVKSRVTAMRGDLQRAIELCLLARETIPAGNLSLQFDTQVTLGYEYYLAGDGAGASQILNEAIQSAVAAGALIYTVAASYFLARLYAVQGQLHKSSETYKMAAQLIAEASGEHRDARALVAVGRAELLRERNELGTALAHVKEGLALLPWWGKVDDLVLAHVALARIHLAEANRLGAMQAVEEATQLVQTRGVFPDARDAVEMGQVKLWLAQGDLRAAASWAASQEERLSSDARFGFGNELAQINRARVWLAQNKPHEAASLLSHLEEVARSAGRMGRVIEILIVQALAMQAMGDSKGALVALTKGLALAQPEGYARVFLDEGQPMQRLLAQWLAGAEPGPLQDYAARLLSQFDAEPHLARAAQVSPAGNLVEPLSQREMEVLHLLALGRTNKEIARELIVAPGTVKAHTSSIYRKLDVANRTEAVARARQLHILP